MKKQRVKKRDKKRDTGKKRDKKYVDPSTRDAQENRAIRDKISRIKERLAPFAGEQKLPVDLTLLASGLAPTVRASALRDQLPEGEPAGELSEEQMRAVVE